MALLCGAVGYGEPTVGLLIKPLVGLVWFLISFRGGRYVFNNVLIGAGIIGVLSAVPLAVVTMHLSLGGEFDLRALLQGSLLRWPVFVLISVAIIKGTLLMSGTTGRVR